jgi:hypothetical protein
MNTDPLSTPSEGSQRRVRGWRFSLRTAFLITTIACVWAYFAAVALHVAVFLTASVFAIAATVAFIRRNGRRRPLDFGYLVVGWICLYLASVGPAAALFESSRVGGEICELLYAPLIVLDRNLPGRPIDDYADQWKRTSRP